MAKSKTEGTSQKPLQRWLVLTEYGAELQPLGARPLADQMAESIRPYRRRTSVVTETAYKRAYGEEND